MFTIDIAYNSADRRGGEFAAPAGLYGEHGPRVGGTKPISTVEQGGDAADP